MNAYGVVLLIAIILTVLYWILSIADKCVKAGKKQQSEKERAVAESFYDNESGDNGNKKGEIEIPVKVLSFKRAMHDISNNV
jgi:hypothetical protein